MKPSVSQLSSGLSIRFDQLKNLSEIYEKMDFHANLPFCLMGLRQV